RRENANPEASMNESERDDRLSQITTLWNVLDEARVGTASAVAAAQELLIRRYGRAVKKYLLSAVRDLDAAQEGFPEVALALARGDLHGADQERGRLRNYVKTVLFHLVAKYRQREGKAPRAVPADDAAVADLAAAPVDNDRQFLESWRNELLERTWEALAAAQP